MARRALVSGFLLVFSLFAAAAHAQTFGAVLTASQEVPPTTSPGFGNFTGTFDASRTNMTITLTVANLGAPISGYHIHEKAAGQQTGGIVINIQGLGGTFVGNKLTGTFPVPADIAARMIANPQNFYVNVHTTQFPGGAIRGDLSITSGTVTMLAADLRGTNEVPSNGSTAVGSALVTIDTSTNTLTWDVNSNVSSPTLAHIHGPNGSAGSNAGVLVGFATSASQFTNGRTSGSLTGLDSGTLNSILANPSSFYVNVHSTTLGGGEIRGQLTAANEYDVPVAGRVTNGLGQTFVTDVRVFNPSYDTAAAALLEYFQAGTSANTTATKSISVNVPPRGTAVLDDIAGASGFNVSGTTGAIRVTSAEKLAVTSRIYADLRSSGKGTFGQFSAGQPRANALRRGVLPQLSNQSDLTSGNRTNIGFFNPNTSATTVRLELRDPAGTLLGSNVVTVQALSQQQASIASYFGGVDLSNAQNVTLSFDASAPMVVYGSTVDNVSADQIFVYAQEDPGVATNQ